MQEIEMKAWLKTPEEVAKARAFLEKNGKFLKKTVKADTYFAKAGADTFDFRLREMDGTYLVTQKTRRLDGNMEENEELEFEVSDKTAFFELVKKIGYVVFLEKQKNTEIYEINGLTAEIVEIVDLGIFLEIEAVGENAALKMQNAKENISKIFQELQLEKNIESQQYAVLLRK